jgi:hypothetical protein
LLRRPRLKLLLLRRLRWRLLRLRRPRLRRTRLRRLRRRRLRTRLLRRHGRPRLSADAAAAVLLGRVHERFRRAVKVQRADRPCGLRRAARRARG